MRATPLVHFALGVAAQSTCKLAPSDTAWPSISDWQALNNTIGGALIATRPAASSCYEENPFESTLSCDVVEFNWTQSSFHASLPESIDYPIWANNSCLPPGASGYNATLLGCRVSGFPLFVVNATTAQQISIAVAWASARDIRVVIKGTGHDLNGRSAGAYALSIWTHHFQSIEYQSQWPLPAGGSASVLIVGSGNNWGQIMSAAASVGRVCVSGQDPTVGLGGFIGGGGHGPFSSHYGLSADNVYQATVVTASGDILVANDVQNQDLLWAVRGGGPGLYGVVTEYVLKTYPTPQSVVTASLSMAMTANSTSYNASWAGLTAFVKSLPDSMDEGLTGSAYVTGGPMIGTYFTMTYFGYNMTSDNITSLLEPVVSAIKAADINSNLNITLSDPTEYASYTDFSSYLRSIASSAGAASTISSRVLGRADVSDLSSCKLEYYLRKIMEADAEGGASELIIGLQGGMGPAQVPSNMRGALNPAWRTGYLHTLVTGASIDATIPPQDALTAASAWIEEFKETTFRAWAPTAGAYINEANPYASSWKQDFYGENYDRLVELKNKFDPMYSFHVAAGVGSDLWDYNLTTGKLCRKD